MPAIIREILRRRPDAASVITLMLEQYCLCIGPVPAPTRHPRCRPLRSWSSCCKHTLLASPSVIANGRATDRAAVQAGRMWPSCSAGSWLLAAGSAQAVIGTLVLQPDALSANRTTGGHRAYRTSAARCQQGLDPSAEQ
jgi:hypothetical protein